MNDPMDELKRRYPEITVPSGEELSRGMRQIISDFAKQLMPFAAARIGIEHRELANRFLGVRLEESHKVNGRVRSFDNWDTFEIVINLGLMIFFHKMMKVFVSTFGFGDDEEHATERPIEPFDKTVSVCKGLMEAFWEDRLLTQGGFWFAEFGKMQMRMTADLVHCCECSVIAHELGHVVRKLSKIEVAEFAAAREIVDGYMTFVYGLDEDAKNQMAESWTEEICADLIGLQLCLAQPNTAPPYSHWRNHRLTLYGGAEIAIILPAMLEDYDWKMRQGGPTIRISPISSHPPNLLRLKAIRSSNERPAFSEEDRLYRDFGGRCGAFAKEVVSKL